MWILLREKKDSSKYSTYPDKKTQKILHELYNVDNEYVPTTDIDYITIQTTGNASDFGDLTVARTALSACSDLTRGVLGGGCCGASNVMDYITVATTGNASDFGDLTLARYQLGGLSDGTTGVFAGGNSGSWSDVMDYITIQTTGNATDFGDMSSGRDPKGLSGD